MKNAILKDKNALLMLAGRSVSLIGTEMQDFALALYMLNITGSATRFASVLAIAMIPKILLGPFSGVVSDWFNRKKIIVSMDFLSGIVIGLSYLVYLQQGELSIIYIYILAIILSTISTIFQPAMLSLVPNVIHEKRIMEFNSLLSMTQTVCLMIAPVLAGMLMSTTGITTILLINAVSFIGSALTEIFIDYTHRIENKVKNKDIFIKDLKDGIVFLKNNNVIWSIMILASIANFAITPIFGIGLPVIVKKTLELEDSMLGLMNAIIVVGMIIGPMVAPAINKKIPMDKLLLFTNLIVSGLLILLGIGPYLFTHGIIINVMMVYILTGIITIAAMTVVVIGNIAVSSLLQTTVPNHYLGRCIAVVQVVVIATVPLGQMFYGIMFDKFDVFTTAIIGSLFVIIGSLYQKKNLLLKNSLENGKQQYIT